MSLMNNTSATYMSPIDNITNATFMLPINNSATYTLLIDGSKSKSTGSTFMLPFNNKSTNDIICASLSIPLLIYKSLITLLTNSLGLSLGLSLLLLTFFVACVLYTTPSMVYDDPGAGVGGGGNETGVWGTKKQEPP